MENNHESKEEKYTQRSRKNILFTYILPIISIILAISSCIISYEAINYTKQINKAVVSLIRIDKKFEKIDNNLFVEFTFVFQNTGNEPLRVDNFCAFNKDFESSIEDTLANVNILNTIYPGVTFNKIINWKFTSNDSKKTLDEMKESVKSNILMVIHIDYSNENMSRSENFYQTYVGGSDVNYTSLDEYNKIEQYLPEEFLLKKISY